MRPHVDLEDQEEELDLTYIDVEEEEDFKTRPPSKCTDVFLSSLCVDSDKFVPGLEESDGEEEDEAADPLEMGHQSEDEDGVGVQFCTHDPSVKWNKMRPYPGERYETPAQLKLCLRNYAISQGYHLRFQKCDNVRMLVRCGRKGDRKQCPFRIWASWMSTERSYQIKKMVDKHNCVRNFKDSTLMTPTWIARQFFKDLIRDPKLKCADMERIIRTKFHRDVSWARCYRARLRAMTLIDGTPLW